MQKILEDKSNNNNDNDDVPQVTQNLIYENIEDIISKSSVSTR